MLELIRQKALDSVEVKQRFFAENGPAVVAVAEALAGVYRNRGRLLSMGNGGSSCDAAHFAVEFLHPVTTGRPALTAINLAADMAMVTAVGNDVGFGHIFVRQVIAHMGPNDGLVGFSTSGNSENLLAAFAKAKELGAARSASPATTAARWGAVRTWITASWWQARASTGSRKPTSPIYHILWDLVHTLLAADRGGVAPGERS